MYLNRNQCRKFFNFIKKKKIISVLFDRALCFGKDRYRTAREKGDTQQASKISLKKTLVISGVACHHQGHPQILKCVNY